MSKRKLAGIIGVCTMAIMIIIAITILPSCGPTTPTPPTYGLQFDGTDDHVALGDAIVLGFTSQDFTIEAWIKLDVTDRGMVIIWRYSWNNDGYRINTGTGGNIQFYTFQSGANQLSKSSSGVLVAGNWSHVAVVRQGASGRVWVDGVDVTTTFGSHIGPAYSASRQTYIGTSYAPEAFDGTISEVRVWNYARSESEIKADMFKELTGTEEGLAGYWKLNEGSGTIAHDSTANSNHGTLEGDPVWFTGGD